MTTLGKVLVAFTVTVSLLMMGFALAVWTNRIDWSDRPPKDGDPGGELARREAEVKRLWNELRVADSGWRVSREALWRGEAVRVQDRAWYWAQLQHAEKGATPQNPCQAVVFAREGVPVPDRRYPGRPQMAQARDDAGQPLASLAWYNQKDEQISKLSADALAKFQQQVERDTQLTNELVGDPIKKTKGLRQRINDERAKRADVEKEEEFVKPLLINTVVESELILKRQKSLRARVGELEKDKVAAGGR